MNKKTKSLVLGITGLIGSGKTTVAELFGKLGATIIDTDSISHQLTTSDSITLKIIADSFGAEYLTVTGTLDREKMRKLVFDDPLARIQLESILHERIYQKTRELLYASTTKITVLVVPLLFRVTKFLQLIDYAIFVDSELNNIYTRLSMRSKLSKAEVDNILATQVAREQQILLADEVIYNNAGLSELWDRVEMVYSKYLNSY